MELMIQRILEDKERSVQVEERGAILIVEDEQMIRDFLQAILEDSGYAIFMATNGIEALQQYTRHMDEIDLVLLDIGIPELSGEEVLEGILSINQKAKVITVSGSIDPTVQKRVMEIGAVDHLTKPYPMAVLLKTIGNSIHERQCQVKCNPAGISHTYSEG